MWPNAIFSGTPVQQLSANEYQMREGGSHVLYGWLQYIKRNLGCMSHMSLKMQQRILPCRAIQLATVTSCSNPQRKHCAQATKGSADSRKPELFCMEDADATVETLLLMEFADLGTLDQTVTSGKLQGDLVGGPVMVYAAALRRFWLRCNSWG